MDDYLKLLLESKKSEFALKFAEHHLKKQAEEVADNPKETKRKIIKAKNKLKRNRESKKKINEQLENLYKLEKI